MIRFSHGNSNLRYADRMKLPWKIRDVVYVFLLAGVLIVVFFLIRFVLMFFGFDSFFSGVRYESLSTFFSFGVQEMAFLVPVYIFTARKYGSKLSDFGFRRTDPFYAIFYAIIAYIVFLIFHVVFFEILSSFGVGEVPGYGEPTPYVPFFGDDAFSLRASLLVIVLIAPVTEEIFFRGFVLQALMSKMNVFVASGLTAILFSLLHFEFQVAVPLFVLGLVLNTLFLKTKNIWPGICFHILNNSFAFLAEYLVLNGWTDVSGGFTETSKAVDAVVAFFT